MRPIVVFDTNLISHFAGQMKRGYDSDSSGLTATASYQWQDLLNSDLQPTDFDTALTDVLRSTTEMEKIQALNEQEFQSVIDALGQVRMISIHCSRSFVC